MQRDVSTRNPTRTWPWRSPLRRDVDHERLRFRDHGVRVPRRRRQQVGGVAHPRREPAEAPGETHPWTVEPATLKGGNGG